MRALLRFLPACSAAAALLFALLSGARLLPLAALHLASAALSVWAALPLLPEKLRARGPWVLALFCALLPVVGGLGLAAALAIAYRPLPALPLLRVRFLSPRAPEDSPAPLSGGRGLRGTLRASRETQRRLSALQATRRLPPRAAVRMLTAALRDPADDVRLLAYAMLQQRERALDERIRAAETRLAAPACEERAALHREVAFLCWEVADQGLVQGALLGRALDKALAHAARALALLPNPELHLLTARIHLRRADAPRAAEALQAARAAGLSSKAAMPWAAELAFRRRDFGEVRDCLQALDRHGAGRGPLRKLSSFWT